MRHFRTKSTNLSRICPTWGRMRQNLEIYLKIAIFEKKSATFWTFSKETWYFAEKLANLGQNASKSRNLPTNMPFCGHFRKKSGNFRRSFPTWGRMRQNLEFCAKIVRFKKKPATFWTFSKEIRQFAEKLPNSKENGSKSRNSSQKPAFINAPWRAPRLPVEEMNNSNSRNAGSPRRCWERWML